MKTKQILYYVTISLLGSTQLPAGVGTNVAQRSCCRNLASAKPLTEKSVYQLDATWTNDDGQTVKLSSLRGRPQVIAMFFANCQSTCPLLVYQMKQVEEALPETVRKNVGFALASFDSKRDTPAALKNYRVQHGLSHDNWTLLNGNADSVLDLAAVLGVKYKEDAQGQFAHSNLITLLNAEGEIVYQQADLSSDCQELVRQIGKLN